MRRIPALDGLRAVAIAMVVGYHIDSAVVPAGHYGVTLFFVLSGYVVTGSLCAEMDRTGRVDLGSSYRNRVLRLLPVLLAVCLAMVAVGTDWSRLIAVLGFYANYARIEGLDLERLTHTWFIAVIAHFYVLWPLVIAALRARHRTRIVGGPGAGCHRLESNCDRSHVARLGVQRDRHQRCGTSGGVLSGRRSAHQVAVREVVGSGAAGTNAGARIRRHGHNRSLGRFRGPWRSVRSRSSTR